MGGKKQVQKLVVQTEVQDDRELLVVLFLLRVVIALLCSDLFIIEWLL